MTTNPTPMNEPTKKEKKESPQSLKGMFDILDDNYYKYFVFISYLVPQTSYLLKVLHF